MFLRRLSFAIALLGLACSAAFAATPATSSNPLLNEWTGPYGGVPPFDQVKVEQFKPALLAAMQQNLEEIDAIANSTDPPTFDNTIVPLERAGSALERVQAVYGVWTGSLNNDAVTRVESEMDPLIAAHGDKIIQNAKLYARIEAVYNSPAKSSLTSEQQRLVWAVSYTHLTLPTNREV